MLEVRNISKKFGALTALEGVSASFCPGEIHAVLGENGAGKSTLMGVLSGFVRPDTGSVTLDGTQVPLGRAFECKKLGIEMIHQHFTLVPAFTVVENLALARLHGLFEKSIPEERAEASLNAAKRLGWSIDPKSDAGSLAVGEQQRLEIIKALGGDAKVLIFDEPTAMLSPEEVEDLFRVLRTLKSEGRIVVIIAHKLSEVLSIADRVTVLRRGKLVASESRDKVDADRLAEWMVGELPAKVSSATTSTAPEPGLVVNHLTVLGDRGEVAVNDLSFQAQRGEVFGIGGVDGNGQIELAEAIVGIREFRGEMTWEAGCLDFEQLRIGYVPQDRQSDGLALGMSILDNLTIEGIHRPEFHRGPFLRRRMLANWAVSLMERFDIRARDAFAAVSSLSGGNQQKVVVSRELDVTPDLLVVANPSRGLDIRATEFVHDQIRRAKSRGAAILLISTDLDELYALSDQVSFLSRGRLVKGDGAKALLGEPT